ncbi:hypothetical protein WALSEDRAFT_65959 [Wallemia mellicola CBS 633.66]|uniref:OTU domain-containing protein n=1 Tax=Wallemia mellicola (strain ATCC MYA-4683 / CBS 633.66) TaxID=671144 RepID=I4Y7L6_WALMC|nr:hypothetical protein WALSEDRAFT_65959 [Wallemia mellicola CBS 633.66]EIM19958.1 hypothetical protein WALSEDRAFT_65959 [Wallemia mellicola CBS 633.66]|eukprot:XP_006960096.1 hypothetical protein WALSEDRAFT_65959 [Wallemia mellicola CBS 633.66]
MAQDYSQLGPPTETYFVCARKEESDKLPVDLGIFCNLKPNQPIHNRNQPIHNRTNIVVLSTSGSTKSIKTFRYRGEQLIAICHVNGNHYEALRGTK